MPYAERTRVPVERSRVEIEKLVRKHGATEFICGFTAQGSAIVFTVDGLRIRHLIPVTEDAQEERRQWRAAVLILKAKFEVIANGYSTIEREFLADLLLPGGGTVADRLAPEIADGFKGRELPRLLP